MHIYRVEHVCLSLRSELLFHVSQDNVFVRLLRLPAVSSTCEVIERTYTSTKQTHPLLCSVCGVYERGARTASSLAAWSIQPAIDRLETQREHTDSLP